MPFALNALCLAVADRSGKWRTLAAIVKRFLRHGPERSPIVVAKAACKQEEWPWREPVQVEDNNAHWVVVTAPDVAGRSARLAIKKTTGQILCKSFIRRHERLREPR